MQHSLHLVRIHCITNVEKAMKRFLQYYVATFFIAIGTSGNKYLDVSLKLSKAKAKKAYSLNYDAVLNYCILSANDDYVIYMHIRLDFQLKFLKF